MMEGRGKEGPLLYNANGAAMISCIVPAHNEEALLARISHSA